MKIGVISTTFYMKEYGQPFMDSLRKTNPQVDFVMVDQTGKRFRSKACAWNYGATLVEDADILFFCDDDLIWADKIVLPEAELFGPTLLKSYHFRTFDIGCDFLEGWCIGVTRKAYEKIGVFDENFVNCGIADCDYSIRAHNLGISAVTWTFPGTHLRVGTKNKINSNEHETRQMNIAYLKGKHKL